MTNDEKAKAYDMALEAARKELGVDRKEWEVVQRVLHNIFPELRESEDERIRKWIFEKVQGYADSGIPCSDEIQMANKALSWLEKQKEQKPVEKQDYSGLNDLERAILRGFLCAGVENVPVTIIKETARDCLAQMKPAEWSDYKDKIDVPYCSSEPEWSEEDEKMLKCCLIAINHYEKTCNIGDHRPTKFNIDGYLAYVDKVKSWLKSLRPSWKPSEEQIKALESCFCEFGEGCPDEDGLRSLYNDLKKLMSL